MIRHNFRTSPCCRGCPPFSLQSAEYIDAETRLSSWRVSRISARWPGSRGFLQLSHPDIPEPHRIAMILQNDRPFAVLSVGRKDWFVSGPAEYFRMILDQDAVVQRGERRFLLDIAAVAEDRRVINDVVGLPFAGFAAGVDQRRVLLINRAGLAVEVGLVVV